MHITTTSEHGGQHGLKMLIHGQAGAGKTRLCATTGDHDKTLILSAEAGLLSLREYTIPVATITSIDDMRQALGYIRREGQRFDWICIDSLSEIAEQCLATEKEKNKNGMKAYGELADTMYKVIRAFRDLPGKHVVFTSKQERIQSEEGLVYAPMLPGRQLSNGIAYLFDEVFALRTAKREDGSIVRWLQTANDGQYECKDRSGALALAEPASLQHIANKILNPNTKEQTHG